MSRLSEWYQKPSAERNRLLVNKAGRVPFRLGLSHFANLYISYQPDSQSTFDLHPEFKELFDRFTQSNRANNAGDWPRFWALVLNLKQVLDDGVQGDFAELGVWRGNTAAVLAHFAKVYDRRVNLFDTFEGFDSRDLTGIDSGKPASFANTSVDHVKSVIGDNADRCNFVKGWFPQSLTSELETVKYCAVSLDCDLYDPMKAGLEHFYPRLSPGGILFLHDYSSGWWNGAKSAIDEFCGETGELLVLMPDKSGSAFVRRTRS